MKKKNIRTYCRGNLLVLVIDPCSSTSDIHRVKTDPKKVFSADCFSSPLDTVKWGHGLALFFRKQGS